MRDGGWHGLLLAAAVAGGLALGAAGSATRGACEATRRGAELLREGRPAAALEQLDAGRDAAGDCEDSDLRVYNRALAHARIGRAAGDRGEAVRHLERASRGFDAVLARDSAEDARWNRALVGDWLERLARESPGGADDGGSTGRSGGSGAGGRGSDTAGAGGAGVGGTAGAPEPVAGGSTDAAEGGDTGEAGPAAAGQGTDGGGEGDRAAEEEGDPIDAAGLEGLLRDASASDRRLRGLILRRALVADGPGAGRW